jgi:hypothetical protein
MRISKDTIKILDYFAELNPSIVFNKGNEIKTCSPLKNVQVTCKTIDTFPIEFGIYDLDKFIRNIKMMNYPKLNFDENEVELEGDDGSILNYFFCDSIFITLPKDISLENESCNVIFELKKEKIEKLLKMKKGIKKPILLIKGCSKTKEINLNVYTCDIENDDKFDTKNFRVFTTTVGKTNKDFEYRMFNFEKLFLTDYIVKIYEDGGNYGVAHFYSYDWNLDYYVALEPKPKYRHQFLLY